MAATGWRVVAVPGLIGDDLFFDHLANRRFPAGNFIRRGDQLDYIQEPDVFPNVFGHVPLLAHPFFADYMQAYGRGGQRATALGRDRAAVAALLVHGRVRPRRLGRRAQALWRSSFGDSVYAVRSPSPRKIEFDLRRVMRTPCHIDDYQQNYFVIRSFEDLLGQTLSTDSGPLYQELASELDIEIGVNTPNDQIYAGGALALSRE